MLVRRILHLGKQGCLRRSPSPLPGEKPRAWVAKHSPSAPLASILPRLVTASNSESRHLHRAGLTFAAGALCFSGTPSTWDSLADDQEEPIAASKLHPNPKFQ